MGHLEFDTRTTVEHKESNSLEHTPTWAVGLVCVVFIALSLLMQRGLQKLGTWLVKRHQKPLNEALTKVKEELMLLGFISLLLTAAQNPISRLCMPDYWADGMLPCHFHKSMRHEQVLGESSGSQQPPGSTTPLTSDPGVPTPIPHHHTRTLLVDHKTSSTGLRMNPDDRPRSDLPGLIRKRSRRILHGMTAGHFCSPGHVPVLPTESLHQLHTFIFVMAVVHVFYSCFTMLFGFTQLRSWRKWEEETRVDNYNYTAEIKKSFNESTFMNLPLGRQNTFIASRTSAACSKSVTGIWINSFFRQFGRPVTKADYLSLRLGFIKNHNAPMKLNFYKYMMRSLEDDLKTVIGISGYLWVFVIFFMILNVHGWYTYFWMSFIPVVINLVIGTKLQHIITQLAMETAHSHGICDAPVKPRDELFWFNKPQLLLHLIHFVLFQNAFELAFCIWLVTTFGFNSCFFNQHGFIISRVIVGILAQVLCSYSTLPLYALVSQMGSHYKKAIFDLPVSNAIQGWRSKAKETRKKRRSRELGRSDRQKAIGHLHMDLHRISSHHSSNSAGHMADDDDSSHLADHSSHENHRNVFHVHEDSPMATKSPKTPRSPNARECNSSRQIRTQTAAAATTGAEFLTAGEQPTVSVEENEDGSEENLESSVLPLPISPAGRPMARTFGFRFPKESTVIEAEIPATAPFHVRYFDRTSRVPSRKIKLTMTDDSHHPTMTELARSSRTRSLPASFSLPPGPWPLTSPTAAPAAGSDT